MEAGAEETGGWWEYPEIISGTNWVLFWLDTLRLEATELACWEASGGEKWFTGSIPEMKAWLIL